jgi:hypothetical protein
MVDEDPEMQQVEQDGPVTNKDVGKVGRIDLAQITRLKTKLGRQTVSLLLLTGDKGERLSLLPLQ